MESIVVLAEDREVLKLVPAHPMLPLLRIASPLASPLDHATLEANYDIVLPTDTQLWPKTVLQGLLSVMGRDLVPKLQDVVDFQIPRGHFGISM